MSSPIQRRPSVDSFFRGSKLDTPNTDQTESIVKGTFRVEPGGTLSDSELVNQSDILADAGARPRAPTPSPGSTPPSSPKSSPRLTPPPSPMLPSRARSVSLPTNFKVVVNPPHSHAVRQAEVVGAQVVVVDAKAEKEKNELIQKIQTAATAAIAANTSLKEVKKIAEANAEQLQAKAPSLLSRSSSYLGLGAGAAGVGMGLAVGLGYVAVGGALAAIPFVGWGILGVGVLVFVGAAIKKRYYDNPRVNAAEQAHAVVENIKAQEMFVKGQELEATNSANIAKGIIGKKITQNLTTQLNKTKKATAELQGILHEASLSQNVKNQMTTIEARYLEIIKEHNVNIDAGKKAFSTEMYLSIINNEALTPVEKGHLFFHVFSLFIFPQALCGTNQDNPDSQVAKWLLSINNFSVKDRELITTQFESLWRQFSYHFKSETYLSVIQVNIPKEFVVSVPAEQVRNALDLATRAEVYSFVMRFGPEYYKLQVNFDPHKDSETATKKHTPAELLGLPAYLGESLPLPEQLNAVELPQDLLGLSRTEQFKIQYQALQQFYFTRLQALDAKSIVERYEDIENVCYLVELPPKIQVEIDELSAKASLVSVNRVINEAAVASLDSAGIYNLSCGEFATGEASRTQMTPDESDLFLSYNERKLKLIETYFVEVKEIIGSQYPGFSVTNLRADEVSKKIVVSQRSACLHVINMMSRAFTIQGIDEITAKVTPEMTRDNLQRMHNIFMQDQGQPSTQALKVTWLPRYADETDVEKLGNKYKDMFKKYIENHFELLDENGYPTKTISIETIKMGLQVVSIDFWEEVRQFQFLAHLQDPDYKALKQEVEGNYEDDDSYKQMQGKVNSTRADDTSGNSKSNYSLAAALQEFIIHCEFVQSSYPQQFKELQTLVQDRLKSVV